MNYFKRQKWLQILLVVLVVLNISTLFLLMKSQRPPKRLPPFEQVEKYLITELKMTSEQVAQFKVLSEEHHQKMRGLHHEQRRFKKVVIQQLKHPEVDDVNGLLEKIGDNQKARDAEMFRYFRSVRSMLNEKQQIAFDDIIVDALEKAGGPGKGPGGHKGPHGPPEHRP